MSRSEKDKTILNCVKVDGLEKVASGIVRQLLFTSHESSRFDVEIPRQLADLAPIQLPLAG